MFERFSDRARRVLVLAQEEANLLHHGFIGTEHLLLGLIKEEEGVAGRALRSLGVALEPVRAKVEETIGMSGTVPSGAPPFTPRAKKVMELSLREALQMGDHHIGTEHLLLGLVREGEGVAASVLVALGADLGRVRQEVISMISGVEGHQRRSGEPIEDSPTWALSSPDPLEPRCPRCRGAIGETARYRTMAIPADEEGVDPKEMVVIYCGGCGATLNAHSA